jgi:hypothetical protein
MPRNRAERTPRLDRQARSSKGLGSCSIAVGSGIATGTLTPEQ